jgi:hypothetical protein
MTHGIAGLYNITCQQGATFQRQLTWTDPARDAYNLTGYTARMQVRSNVTSNTIIATLSTTAGNTGTITLGGTAGTVDLLISATNTAALTAGQYVYDLELVSGGGVVTRLLEGNFKVTAEVTR